VPPKGEDASMAAAPEGLARRGGVGGFNRRIVDAEGRRICRA
jgi:hypothetical protein